MNKEIEDINRIARKLLTEGRDLLRRLELTGISDSQLPRNLSNWITLTTEQLIELMPKNCPDYKIINEIHSKYTQNQNILLPTATADVRIVLNNLLIARECVVAALSSDNNDLSPENLAGIYYEQLKKLADYVKDELIQKLKGKEDGRTRKTAMLNIYGRIYLLVMSMVKLDGMEDVLALGGCVRTILELYIDLNLFDCKAIINDVEKFFSFQRVEKWNKARNIVRLRKDFNLIPMGEITPIDKFLSEPGNEESKIKDVRREIWGKSNKGGIINPQHWTNKSLVDRVRLLDNDVAGIYVSLYYYCNFLVHSMYDDSINDTKTVHLFNWRFYDIAYTMFLKATKLVNKISKAFPSKRLGYKSKDIETETFKRFFGEMVKAGRCNSKIRKTVSEQ